MSSGHELAHKRRRIMADLRSISGCARNALAEILRVLQTEGGMNSDMGRGAHRTIRDQLKVTVDVVLADRTPYGPLVDRRDTPCASYPHLEFVNPFALLHVLCSRRPEFFDALATSKRSSACRKVLLYIDEITPGNPLRPKKSRTTQCVYWIFADLPAYLFANTDFWFVLATVRSNIVSSWPGDVSGFMAFLMKVVLVAGRAVLRCRRRRLERRQESLDPRAVRWRPV